MLKIKGENNEMPPFFSRASLFLIYKLCIRILFSNLKNYLTKLPTQKKTFKHIKRHINKKKGLELGIIIHISSLLVYFEYDDMKSNKEKYNHRYDSVLNMY